MSKTYEIKQFTCPKCEAHWYGYLLDKQGNVISRSCHGSVSCTFTWPVKDDDLYFKGTGKFESAEGVGQYRN